MYEIEQSSESGLAELKIMVWKILEGEAKAVETSAFPDEQYLEDLLENNPRILGQNLITIGRQVEAGDFGTLDLLFLDSKGTTIVIELKKGKTPRDVVAQLLGYASWLRDLKADRIRELADQYLRKRGKRLEEVFKEKYGLDSWEEVKDNINQEHRLLIVATEPDDITQRIVEYLLDCGVPINIVTLNYFRDPETGKEYIARVYSRSSEEVDVKIGKPEKLTWEGFERRMEESGLGNEAQQIRSIVSELQEKYKEELEASFGTTFLNLKTCGGKATIAIDSRPISDNGVWVSDFSLRQKIYELGRRLALDKEGIGIKEPNPTVKTQQKIIEFNGRENLRKIVPRLRELVDELKRCPQ